MLTASTSRFRLASLVVFALVAIGGTYVVRLGETPVLPETPYDYEGTALPSYLGINPRLDNTPSNNPITNAGATLGRVLFYDTRLSRNETIACASCHLQEHGFSDPRPLSVGFDGEQTARHSMALVLPRYDLGSRFFWDKRAPTLENLALQPIQDPIEMGMTLDELTDRLAATSFYPDLFADAFGTPEVTSDRVARALAQFIRSIVASNTKYDAAREADGRYPGAQMAGLTDQENLGLKLFYGRGGCQNCHVADLFMGGRVSSNGLDLTITDEGAGLGRFKVVTLRNIGLTAPYMHDGRFETLEEVIDHYSTGIQHSPGLDFHLIGPGGAARMNFTDEEKAGLVAFLHTLTDSTIATNPMWSDPFPAQAAGTDIDSGVPR